MASAASVNVSGSSPHRPAACYTCDTVLGSGILLPLRGMASPLGQPAPARSLRSQRGLKGGSVTGFPSLCIPAQTRCPSLADDHPQGHGALPTAVVLLFPESLGPWRSAMRSLGIVSLAVMLLVAGCGGGGGGNSSPTSPTVTPAPTPDPIPTPLPTPIPSARLQLSGRSSWTRCDLPAQSCYLAASMQNMGPGCATSTTVVGRIYDATGAQSGADIEMGAIGGLSAKTIRPNEIVALTSLLSVGSEVNASYRSFGLFPTWTDVICP